MIDIERFWKVGVRVLHNSGYIKDSEFVDVWEQVTPDYMGCDEYIASINNKIYEIMLNAEEIKPFLSAEVEFLRSTEIPEYKSKFKSLWYSMICDMEYRKLINLDEHDRWFNGTHFEDTVWSRKEIRLVNAVKSLIQQDLVSKNPSMLDYIDEPSFDVLMTANGMIV